MSNNPFDYIKSIMQTEEYMYDDEQLANKEYNPFLTNRALSMHRDCIMYANEINSMYDLDKKLQYDYLFYSIRKFKRKFVPWPKKVSSKELDLIMEYYNCSLKKALEYIKILSNEQVKEIERSLKKGG